MMKVKVLKEFRDIKNFLLVHPVGEIFTCDEARATYLIALGYVEEEKDVDNAEHVEEAPEPTDTSEVEETPDQDEAPEASEETPAEDNDLVLEEEQPVKKTRSRNKTTK